jgi:hypothetical protein
MLRLWGGTIHERTLGAARRGVNSFIDFRRFRITTALANGRPQRSSQTGWVVTLRLHFEGVPFSHKQQVGAFDPNFAGDSP